MESLSQPQTIPCDIVLLPSHDQAELAVQASQTLAHQGSLFTLDNQHFYAHASLYMFQMDVAQQDRCVVALERLAQQTSAQQLQQDGYFYQDSGHGKGYVDVAYRRNDEVDALQERVIAMFNELRAGMRESDKKKMTDATGLKLENLQKYGYPAAGELFRPHITLTKFPIEIEPDLSGLPPATIFDGMFTRLGLFEMGQNGTCVRKIAEYRLLKK
ncbi:DUF1045 domain-containing protein [Streptomyces caniscabiei]|uniref:DUF1045 domain-containing protein n=1 Tax=Streptomyces caniscabiei TaxID=2746961 RepID=UPI0029A9406A|nr:DUF1045 domain-containing protein [Streptomyces caniscabiei]MDX2775791.1 DUF1045 domain-containing protein [Streptomyces caniscabiei]